MVLTGEVLPDDNLAGAYARNSLHKDNGIFVRYFISEKHRLFFMPLTVFCQGGFVICQAGVC